MLIHGVLHKNNLKNVIFLFDTEETFIKKPGKKNQLCSNFLLVPITI